MTQVTIDYLKTTYPEEITKEQFYRICHITGVAVFEDVLIGTGYVLTEENMAMRYALPEEQNVDVKWNEVTGATVKNILKKWRADVCKVDASVMATERRFYLDAPCFRRKVDGEMPRYFLN